MADRLPSIAVRSLTHDAFDTLRDAILDGRLEQGERINEVQVSRTLGISRGPLREALRRLEQDGLVRSTPNRGASVVRVSARDALDLLNVRRLLEPYAVLEAFKRDGAGLISLAQRAVDEMRVASRTRDRSREAMAHSRYHGLFYERSGNTVLDRMWTRLEDPVRLFLRLRQTSTEEMLEVAAAHELLLGLLDAGDTVAIRSEVLAHLDVSRNSLRKIVAGRGRSPDGGGDGLTLDLGSPNRPA